MFQRLLLLCAFLLNMIAVAQRPLLFTNPFVENPQVRFLHLTTDNGLSNNRVTSFLQDPFGYIWIGTVDGLNRYDGRVFEVYKHNPDNYTSISSSHISTLVCDQAGNLFVGTKTGLNVYNRLTNSFQTLPLEGDSAVPLFPYIRELLFESDSVLWIDIQEGKLLKYNLNKRRITAIHNHLNSSQPYYLYHDLYKDNEGEVWLGVRGQPVMYLNAETQIIEYLQCNANDYSKKRANDVACYFEDSKENFWISALDGVYLFNKLTQTFKKFIAVSTFDIKEDNKGNIWFATGSGILKYSPVEQTIMEFNNEKGNPHSISNNSVHKILEDKVGNLWFATSMGINIYNPSAYPFNTYTYIPGISNSPEGYVVTAVAEDNHQNLWIGYEEDGLDYFNTKNDRFAHHNRTSGGVNQLAANNVSSLYFDSKNRLWIGLWRGIGFNLYEPDKDKFSLFTYYPENLEKDWYSDFCVDDKDQFYIGFWGADGLTLFDRDKLKFGKSLRRKFLRETCSRIITRLYPDNNHTIWVGTTECGLHRYSPDRDTSISYFSDGEVFTGLISNDIRDITQDANGNIWVLTSTLQKFDETTNTFSNYGFAQGFFSNEPVSILPDRNGCLWISTKGDGLFKFNIKNENFTQYLKTDGIQGNTFTSARLALKDGRLFFGGVTGFNLFNPNEIVIDTMVPLPFFGRLFIYDHIYSHDLNQHTSITLKPDEKVFSIELNSTDMVNPERYLYQCKLIGFDESWVDIDNTQRRVRYTSVPPGNYQLEYRIGNRNGNWSNNTACITFHLERPFYQTVWFIILVVLLLALILWLLYKRRERQLKLEVRAVELQQRIFRLQLNPHFMGNSLLAIQNFIYLHKPIEAGNYISDFARLFRLILNNSKSEFILISKEIETLELYLKLQRLRFPEKFDFNFEIDDAIDPDVYRIPPMLAQPMIENALEHGLFSKESRGNLIIRLLHHTHHLILEVEDNGIGLSAALKLTSGQKDHQSTALQITRERIELLGKKYGFIVIFEVKELIGKGGQSLGTKVRFTLPFIYS